MKFTLIILLLSVVVLSCKKDEEKPKNNGPDYQIVSGSVAGITNKVAVVTGNLANLNGKNITAYGHVWSTAAGPAISLPTKTNFGATQSDTTFTSQIIPLSQGTAYHVRAYATDASGTWYGTDVSFTTETSFFEFVVSSNYLSDDSYLKERCWVMVYNSANDMLGLYELANGETCTFDWSASSKDNNYKVQLFTFNDYVNPNYNDYYYLGCFLNVEPEVWYLGQEPVEDTYTPIGTNTVTLDFDMSGYYNYAAQSLYSWANFDNSNYSFTFDQYFNPDKIWIMYHNESEAPFYRWIDNVGLNENFSFSPSDFIQMTDFVNISLPANTYSSLYIESEDDLTTDFWEYFQIFYQNTDGLTTAKVYYPADLFSGYFTYIRVADENTSQYMVKYRGPVPDQFTSLNVNVNVVDESILNYGALFTGTADVFNSYWYYYDPLNFTTFDYSIIGSTADVSTYSAPPLPPELINLNSSLLDLNKLEYNGSNFREYNWLSGYPDYIKKTYTEPGAVNIDYQYYYSKTIYKEHYQGSKSTDLRKEIQHVKKNPFSFKM